MLGNSGTILQSAEPSHSLDPFSAALDPTAPNLFQSANGIGADLNQGAPALIVPWWQTNQPPSNLVTGPRLGTDVMAGLTPGLTPVLPPLAEGGRPDVPPALRWGPVIVRPYLGYGVSYGSGLLGSAGGEGNTVMNTVSPGLTFDIGRYWSVSYAPSFVFYTADGFDNTVNQSVSIQGAAAAGNWDLSVANFFSDSDNPLVETGAQTQQTVNTTQFGAMYPLTPVLSLDLGVAQALRWTGEFNNTFSWSTENSLNYRLRPQASIGVGLGFEYDLVEPGTDMTSESISFIFQGGLGDKLSYGLSGGFEVRQFLQTDAGMKVSPLFSGNINYSVTEKTLLTLYYNRQVSPAYYDDQFTESASVGGSVSQRILGRFNLSLTGGYRWTDDNSTFDPTQIVQTANYAFVRVGVGARFLRRGSASIFYMWSDNEASNQALAYSSNQVGLQMSYGW